jgi:hypothetical protein
MNQLREKLGSPRKGTITLSVNPPDPLAIRVIRDIRGQLTAVFTLRGWPDDLSRNHAVGNAWKLTRVAKKE